jgi:hypothetical protein
LVKTVPNSAPYDAIDVSIESEMHRLKIPNVSLAIVEVDQIVPLHCFSFSHETNATVSRGIAQASTLTTGSDHNRQLRRGRSRPGVVNASIPVMKCSPRTLAEVSSSSGTYVAPFSIYAESTSRLSIAIVRSLAIIRQIIKQSSRKKWIECNRKILK